MSNHHPFHYAFLVKDLLSTRKFYMDLLGCSEGRSTDTWVDFNFFGHQLSAHLSDQVKELDYCGQVDGVKVPMPHFGCIIPVDTFQSIAKKLESEGISFILPPQLRYEGKVGEQWTIFVLDYSNNPIEFKAFTDVGEVYGG